MATIERRGPGQFRATIRRKGLKPQRRTFPTRALADQWARDAAKPLVMAGGFVFWGTCARAMPSACWLR